MRLPEPGDVPGLIEAKPLVGPATLLRLPPRGFIGRYAYVICRADSHEACDAALDEAIARVEVDVDPADH
jgi:hypothetical protein